MIAFDSLKMWEYADTAKSKIKHTGSATGFDNPQKSIEDGNNLNGWYKVFHNMGADCFAPQGTDSYCKLRGLKFHSYRDKSKLVYYLVDTSKRYNPTPNAMLDDDTTCADCLTTSTTTKGAIYKADVGEYNEAGYTLTFDADPSIKRKFGIPSFTVDWGQYITSAEKVSVQEELTSEYAQCNMKKYDITV